MCAAVVIPGNLATEFEIGTSEPNLITVRLGPGLFKRAADGALIVNLAVLTNTVQGESTELVKSPVTVGQDINDNGTLQLSGAARADGGWAVVGNELRYTGTPDRVRLEALVHNVDPGGASRARANPSLRIQRWTGTAWAALSAWSATGYIRDGTGHTESSNSVVYLDEAPPASPRYRFQTRQESSEGDPVNAGASSHVAAEAVLVAPLTYVTAVTPI